MKEVNKKKLLQDDDANDIPQINLDEQLISYEESRRMAEDAIGELLKPIQEVQYHDDVVELFTEDPSHLNHKHYRKVVEDDFKLE